MVAKGSACRAFPFGGGGGRRCSSSLRSRTAEIREEVAEGNVGRLGAAAGLEFAAQIFRQVTTRNADNGEQDGVVADDFEQQFPALLEGEQVHAVFWNGDLAFGSDGEFELDGAHGEPRCQYSGLEEIPPILQSESDLKRGRSESGSGFDEAEQLLESESDNEEGEAGERTSKRKDGVVPFLVGKVESGKLGAEPGIDSIFGQLAEAEKASRARRKPPRKVRDSARMPRAT